MAPKITPEKPYSITDLCNDVLNHSCPDYHKLKEFCIRSVATYADCVENLRTIRNQTNSKIIDDLISKQHILFHGLDSDPDSNETPRLYS